MSVPFLISIILTQNQLFRNSFGNDLVSFSSWIWCNKFIEWEDAKCEDVYFFKKESDEVLAE
jgi:hypothetical protein